MAEFVGYCTNKQADPLPNRYLDQSLYDYVARNWGHLRLVAMNGPDHEYAFSLNGEQVTLTLMEEPG